MLWAGHARLKGFLKGIFAVMIGVPIIPELLIFPELESQGVEVLTAIEPFLVLLCPITFVVIKQSTA